MLAKNLHSVEIHWKKTYKNRSEQFKKSDPEYTDIDGWKRIKNMGDMCRHISQMLYVINDTIMPRGFEQNVGNNFEAVVSRLLPEVQQ